MGDNLLKNGPARLVISKENKSLYEWSYNSCLSDGDEKYSEKFSEGEK